MIKLSIIIVNFNSGLFLKKCLLSIEKSILSPQDYEVIIVDNNSKDISIEEALKVKGINLILIQNKKNVGFAVANNQGIKKAKGGYILLLNPDTLISTSVLHEMINFMEKNPKVGIATGKVILPNGELDDACHRGFPTPWNAFFHFTGIARIFPQSKFLNGYHLGYHDLNKIHEIDACAGAFMIIRREAGKQVRWLDEDYFWYGEDLDFCFRVKFAGWKIMFVPNVAITHYKGVSAGIKSHSQHLTTADHKTRLLATKARFEVMRIFYEKHYKDKYPKLLTWVVLTGIRIKEYLSLLKYQ